MIWNKTIQVLAVIAFTATLFGQEIVENPAKPAAKNAGRAVAFKEIATVRDGGEEFYFEWPRNIQAAPDGSFFLVSKDQLLQFDASGRFLRNYYKRGQGPGEMQYGVRYGFDGRTLVVFNFAKVLRFDLDGHYLGEYRVSPKAGNAKNFLRALDGRVVFVKWAFPAGKTESEVVDMPQVLVSVSGSGEDVRELSNFPIKAYVMRSGRGGGALTEFNRLLTASASDGRMFISHTQEYLVKLYDPASDRVIRTFRRKYNRVPPTAEEEERWKKPGAYLAPGKPVIPPAQKYSNDIRALFVVDDRLWVLTSTIDPEKGKLVDVFDLEGRYLDNFYLPLPENLARENDDPIWVSGDRLYLIEVNPDETAILRVFKIEDPGTKR